LEASAARVARAVVAASSVGHMTQREDRGLVEGQWDDLNRAFYGREGGPHAYIAARLEMLGATDDRDVRIVESVNLLHHAAEALVRHYLAHRGAPACPWLDMARLRNFPLLKAAVSELGSQLESGTLPDDLVPVFYGPADSSTPAAKAVMARAEGGLSALLSYASALLLDEAGMYNAIKHGLAAVPGVRTFPEAESQKLPAPRGGGTSLLTLQPKEDAGRRQWTRVVTFVDVDENIAMVELIGEQLENLWHVARTRYLGVPLARLHPLTKEQADKARFSAGLDAPGMVLEVGASLLYYVEEPTGPSPDQDSTPQHGE